MKMNDYEKTREFFMQDAQILHEKIKSLRVIPGEEILPEALNLSAMFKSIPTSNKFKFRLIEDNRVFLNSIVLKFFLNLIRHHPGILEEMFLLKSPESVSKTESRLRLNFKDLVKNSPRKIQMASLILSEYVDCYKSTGSFSEKEFTKFAANLFESLGVFRGGLDYNVAAFEKFFIKFKPKSIDLNKKSYYMGLIFSGINYRRNYLVGVLKTTKVKNFNLFQFINGIANDSFINWLSNVRDHEFYKWLYRKIGPLPIILNDILSFDVVPSLKLNDFIRNNKNYFDFKTLKKDFKCWFINQPRQKRSSLFKGLLLAGEPERPGHEISVTESKKKFLDLIYDLFDTEAAKYMDAIPLAYNVSIEDNEFDASIKKCLILGFKFRFFNPFLKEFARSQNISMRRAQELYDESVQLRFGLEIALNEKIRNKIGG